MKNISTMRTIIWLPKSLWRALAVLLATAALTTALADPLDETARNTFHLSPIGVWDQRPGGTNSVVGYRSRMLSLTGGVMPKNVKAGVSSGLEFLQSTHGGYYDYLFSPGKVLDFTTYTVAEIDYVTGVIISNDIPFGVHVNGMPWADSAIQSEDILHNYLEKFGGGSYLQVDRLGRIRTGTSTDVTTNEVFSASDALEMQVTLSRNATLVQDYAGRNCRIAMRVLGSQREQHPDLITFASMSSEVAQNIHANTEYCDYSSWSKQEFRDWLSGTNLYAGQAQYASLTNFNAAFSGASGFPWASWDVVQPPTNVNWSTFTATGRWWRKWHDFRTNQVGQMVQAQVGWCRDAGWNPDSLYGHQIPLDPASTSDDDRKYASPWTTTFVNGAGNGITTYYGNASATNIFSAIRANDKNWGIFEYNPITNSVAANLAALDTVWNSGGRVIAPYTWWGFDTYQIYDRPLQTALSQFIFNHSNQSFTNLAPYEVSPAARDVIWAMSESDDIESSSGVSALVFTNGILSGQITNATPMLSLEFNESPTRFILSDQYYAASFRFYLSNALVGFGQIAWVDNTGATNAVTFPARPGWNVYRVNLAENAAWREKKIQALEFRPASASGNFSLDWFRLEAAPCWHFDDANEIYGVNDVTNATIAGGIFSGTSGPDAYFYFSTDKRNASEDADRAYVDANTYKKVRVRLTSSTASTGQMFWWKRGTSFFTTTFAVAAGTQTYELDLSADPNWTGDITRLRLDPVNQAGIAFEVDYLSVAPVMLPPRIANSDLIVNSPAPVFLWDGAFEPNHSGVSYTLELSTNFFFTNAVFATNGLTGSRLVYNGTPVLDGLYWWRIRARDAAGNLSPWAVPMPMFVRTWNFNQLADIASSNQFGAAAINSGVWQATSSGNDPYMNFNTGSPSNRGVNADLYNRFVCRVKVATGVNNFAQFFWFPKSGGFAFTSPTLPADNAWHDLDIDLSQNAQWKGYQDSVRLDPTSLPATQVSLDYAYLLPALEPAAQPGNWQFNTNGNFEGWQVVNGFTSPAVTNGALTGNLFAANAALQIAPLNLNGSSNSFFQFRVLNQTAATSAWLHWTTTANAYFDSNKAVLITLTPNDTGRRSYAADLMSNTNWVGNTITALRLQPAADATSGRIEIDWIQVTAQPTNQAPSFTKGANVVLLEDTSPQTFSNWATNISAGPANDAWQTVAFIVTNNNNSIFSTQPAINPTGNLSLALAANANGAATVTVRLQDNGGIANGGQDSSAPQTFTVTVTLVNDAPSFTPGSNVVVNEDSGPQNFANWATNITAGPLDETAQTVSFTVTNNNDALFSAPPVINSSGTLTFTIATNAFGVATISATLTDSGGTANGGQNSSAQQFFTITVNAVNDLPVAAADSIFAHWNTATTIAVSNLLANDSDPDGGVLSVTGVTTPSASGGGVSLAGSLVNYQPPTNYFGADGFNYFLSDGQGGQSTGAVSLTIVRPTITAWQMSSNGAFRLEFSGIPNTAYTLQTSSNLLNWPSLSTNATGSNGLLSVDDVTATNAPQRYYRFVWP